MKCTRSDPSISCCEIGLTLKLQPVCKQSRFSKMQVEDLSCMETTIFDRVFDDECTTDVEAESQLLMSAASYQAAPANEDDVTSLIR